MIGVVTTEQIIRQPSSQEFYVHPDNLQKYGPSAGLVVNDPAGAEMPRPYLENQPD
jgi:hypothetical protein